MMRTNIAFKTEDGVTLHGWHSVPAAGAKLVPTVVMAHGFGALKEMYLDRFADAFALAGLASLVFDHRGFGESEGTPRQEVDPWQQISDYRDAITFAETLEATDPTRIGIWGSDYSGGHALVVGAIDRRVRCVVAQVPMVSGHANVRRLVRPDFFSTLQRLFENDRRGRLAGQAPSMVAVVSEDAGQPSALRNNEAFDWYSDAARALAPAWRNEVTLRSVEMFSEYEPGAYARYVSPTPLLMVVALKDTLTVADLALEAFENALEPKRLVTLAGGHFDAYVRDFGVASGAAAGWFCEWLGVG
jgi:fermentation-respiration switch protein FrsA (DUF1100 family)